MKITKNTRTNTKSLVLTAMFIAIGIVLPMAFHAVPNAGKIMLPMHIPVILCGFICGPIYGLLAGILTPILSSVMTQMPPLYPMAVIMLCELATYGFVAGILIRVIKTKFTIINIYLSLIIALVVGRIVSAPMSCAIFHMPFDLWVSGTLAAAVPGLLIQLTLIPALLFALERAKLIKMDTNGILGLGKYNNNKKIKAFFDQKATGWDDRQIENEQMIKELIDKIDIKENSKVLDIACGTGVLDRELINHGAKEIVAIDISDKMIGIAKEKNKDLPVTYIVQDFYDFDQKDFDLAIIYNAYPHFLDKENLVESVNRALKPNGRFVVMHSMGREKLNAHHGDIDKSLSKALLPATVEAENFENKFTIDLIVDSKDLYIFSGIKK